MVLVVVVDDWCATAALGGEQMAWGCLVFWQMGKAEWDERI
jgi:hypothetical protein